MIVRRGRPGLLGTVARTAVIAGTATATANAVNRHAAGKQAAAQQQQAAAAQAAQEQADLARQVQDQQAQLAALQAQQASAQQTPAEPVPAAPAPAPGGADDLVGKLQHLADLKAAGVLTDEEFAAAKAKLLGS